MKVSRRLTLTILSAISWVILIGAISGAIVLGGQSYFRVDADLAYADIQEVVAPSDLFIDEFVADNGDELKEGMPVYWFRKRIDQNDSLLLEVEMQKKLRLSRNCLQRVRLGIEVPIACDILNSEIQDIALRVSEFRVRVAASPARGYLMLDQDSHLYRGRFYQVGTRIYGVKSKEGILTAILTSAEMAKADFSKEAVIYLVDKVKYKNTKISLKITSKDIFWRDGRYVIKVNLPVSMMQYGILPVKLYLPGRQFDVGNLI